MVGCLIMIQSAKEVIEYCQKENLKLSDIAIIHEKKQTGLETNEIIRRMGKNLEVMLQSVGQGLNEETKGHLIGGEAKKLYKYTKDNKSVSGNVMSKAISYALAVLEVNASMGRVVACPTAGSSGVMPAIIKTMQEEFAISDYGAIKGILASSVIGVIIGREACLAGAQGGCQAEVGSASAMAAAAIVEIMGGTVSQAFDSGAIALKNIMGLICDPVAGLVEVPCAKRNTIGVANALISAEMALAGIESVIPFDEVVWAMDRVSKLMPSVLKETSEGGIAITPTAIKLTKEIFKK